MKLWCIICNEPADHKQDGEGYWCCDECGHLAAGVIADDDASTYSQLPCKECGWLTGSGHPPWSKSVALLPHTGCSTALNCPVAWQPELEPQASMTPQRRIAANVAARGYRDGWTDEQFIARQVAKLTEELAELSKHIVTVGDWQYNLGAIGEDAKHIFDTGTWEWRIERFDASRAKVELTDVVVVALTMADAFGFDAVQAAVEKSSQDIKRGKR